MKTYILKTGLTAILIYTLIIVPGLCKDMVIAPFIIAFGAGFIFCSGLVIDLFSDNNLRPLLLFIFLGSLLYIGMAWMNGIPIFLERQYIAVLIEGVLGATGLFYLYVRLVDKDHALIKGLSYAVLSGLISVIPISFLIYKSGIDVGRPNKLESTIGVFLIYFPWQIGFGFVLDKSKKSIAKTA